MSQLRVNQARDISGFSRETLYRYMKNGKLAFQEIDGTRWIDADDLRRVMAEYQELKAQRASRKKDTGQTLDLSPITDRLDTLTASIDALTAALVNLAQSAPKNVPERVTPASGEMVSGDNARRAEEARQAVFTALDDLRAGGGLPMYRGKVSAAAVGKASGINRDTVSKYLPEWLAQNGPV